MSEPYLEVTFRHGKVLAAYLYLPRRARERSLRASRVEPGLIVDFARDGRPIGIEITAPGKLSLAAMNRLLRKLGMPLLARNDLAPLRAVA